MLTHVPSRLQNVLDVSNWFFYCFRVFIAEGNRELIKAFDVIYVRVCSPSSSAQADLLLRISIYNRGEVEKESDDRKTNEKKICQCVFFGIEKKFFRHVVCGVQ